MKEVNFMLVLPSIVFTSSYILDGIHRFKAISSCSVFFFIRSIFPLISKLTYCSLCAQSGLMNCLLFL